MANLSTTQAEQSRGTRIGAPDSPPSVTETQNQSQFDKLSEGLIENFDKARDELTKYGAQMTSLVREKPGIALLAAVGVGAGIGWAIGRFLGSRQRPLSDVAL